MILNNADDIKSGNGDVLKVYSGDIIVWQRGSAPTPPGTVLTSSDFIVGGIRGSNGEYYSNDRRLMCEEYFPCAGKTAVHVEIKSSGNSTLWWCFQLYKDDYTSGSSYEQVDWITPDQLPAVMWTGSADLTGFPSDFAYLRFLLRDWDSSYIYPSEVDHLKFYFT